MSPQMPYSPLDALLDCLPRVRKAGKVTKTDDVLSVQRRIADVFLPIVKRIQADEARMCAKLICHFCAWPEGLYEPVKRDGGRWRHRIISAPERFLECSAGPIHERLHRESQKGGNHAKTETQTGMA